MPAPPPPFDNIPKYLWDKHGNRSLNIEWVKELVRFHKDDKQLAHTAAALPVNDLNKGCQNAMKDQMHGTINAGIDGQSTVPLFWYVRC